MATAAGVAGYVVARASGWGQAKAPATAAPGYGTGPGTGAGTVGKYLVRLSALPGGGGGLILASANVVLVREPNGQVKGFSATCTHEGCTVGTVAKGVISCPCHGSQFSALTGAVVQGPATIALPSVPVAVHDGGVYTLA